ncbi:hypothetical protein [Halomonas sp. E19]|uniref:hypothetical protein n=1 Tax=Halomonas sp. E19 TaxID=3397247 RepID=UPI004033BC53
MVRTAPAARQRRHQHRLAASPRGPWPRQERAKAACKADLEAHRHNGHRLAYRIVRAHAPTQVDAESHPPHGWRLRWRIPDTSQTPRPKEA